MTREDKKITAITPEEKYFAGILPSPLRDWEEGKEFLVTDDKAILIFETAGLPSSSDSISLNGKILSYTGLKSKINAAGVITLSIIFTDGQALYAYDTGKEFDSSMEEFLSNEVPMLIDLDMVDKARGLLTGKNLWTRSSLWYDEQGERIDGKKYVPVIIAEVMPGNLYFPLKLKILTENGDSAYMFMNYGNADTESRSFHNLFSLSDIRKHFPSVQPQTWDYISVGKVTAGMTKDECRLSLGNPTEISSGHDYSQTLDIWSYPNGTILWFEDGRLVRYRQY